MKNFITKKIAISVVLIMIMCFNSVGVSAICDELKGESILHAWCWSFKTIKENMGDIAAAGYKAVQVSPPQECAVKTDCPKCKHKIVKVKHRDGTITRKRKGCKHFTENWYMHYQPTNFKIGNDQLGTKKEFKEMCKEAKKHDVKIIVDVVANHVANDLNQVSDDVKNINEVFHGYGDLKDHEWTERWKVVNHDLLGLKGLNTGKKEVQNMIMNYMNDCLDCGAWGFRYDAAQHIELPDEIDRGFGSDYWPTILDNAKRNGAKFQYGEVWQFDYSRFSDYAKYMNVTAMNYGQNVRDAICRKDLGHWNFTNYDANGVDPDKLVTWVESHDNYANSDKLRSASSWMSDEEVKAGWAIVASRKAGVPMFFSRPDGSGGPNRPKFSEQTKLGDKGSDLFKNPCVVAVNKFRKAMKDQDEYLRSQNNKTLMIERGNKGMVIVNWSENQEINSETRLADGTYIDRASDTERKFEVRNGRIYGNTWGANSGVVVLTRADEPLA